MHRQLLACSLLLPAYAQAQDVAKVLAIESSLPWGQSFATEFGARGMEVDILTTPLEVSTADLSHYSVVALTGGQSDNLITSYNERLSELDDWVDAGGLLIVHAGVTSVSVSTGAVLPGAPGGSPTYALGTFPSCGDDLTMGTSAFTNTLPFTNAYCAGAWPVFGGSLAHDELTFTGNVNDQIIIVSDVGSTLLFERAIGDGLVVMGTLTYEYGYANNQDAGRVMDRELAFAEGFPCDDADGDQICALFDVCLLGDDTVDGDGDGVADACDPCPADAPDDTDGDGVCDSYDTCDIGNDNDDADGDATPDACDCEPYVATAYPGAQEVCGGLDDDCDGLIDEDDPSLDSTSQALWYYDLDGDGFGDTSNAFGLACSQPADTVTTPGDCDDADGSVYPGAPETVGDGIDQDCDGVDSVPPEPTADTGSKTTDTGAGTADTGPLTPTADTGITTWPTGDTGTITVLPTGDSATSGITETATTDTAGTTDTGGATDTGLPDPIDPDSDGDGVPDSIDPQPTQAGSPGERPVPAAPASTGCGCDGVAGSAGWWWLGVVGLGLVRQRRQR